ncbi:MAG: hypothetical protein A2848_02200 [Candidatus Magasanikbacteria bacterium RIFCSPHIGHO2_01_FULL_50_8]|uniref:Endolytic murein transglycosylase n=2 Tax=Candidatus Magasanikiibacteriota TaxID=1752731 RepID=A0A1F6LP08_9BACT|nr:MAG: hypothetical protein A2848_02200 [Candidatus Magasanikbacteria bacterium RIFCSPHIGHO2_01_FULL_50_8]OGH67892.1 MAG: hypothetical protein A3C15_01675 [Candidatus Magasanikbacteria bacterium RIFCSPHIGHO2_02_FULL_50_9b]
MKRIVLFFLVLAVASGAWWFVRRSANEAPAVSPPAPRLTLTEGRDLRDLAELMVQKKMVTSSADLYALIGEPAHQPTVGSVPTAQFDFLRSKPRGISLEGYLFPDTYEISLRGGASELVSTMLKNFDRKFTPAMRADAAGAGRTIHEVVTVASILEKEVRGARDRRMVADILWRRADAGWGLQVDASVNYVTGKSGRFTSAADRASLSAWNTYKHRGLPPGPIGNPGVATLEAALEPEQNKFWFYLTAPDGTVHYGRTLEEHNANKKYLR